MPLLRTTVLVPGFLCDERLWKFQIATLRARGPVRAVNPRYAADLPAMIGLLDAVEDEAFDLVGFSMGGYLAQVFAAKNPVRVRSLTLIGTSGGTLSPEEIRARETMARVLEKTAYRGISDRELARTLHPNSFKVPAIADTVRAMCADNTSAMYLAQMRATLHRTEHAEAIDRHEYPVRIVAGRDDRVVPLASIENLHAAIARSTLHIAPDCGHYVPLERPDFLNDVLSAASSS